MLKDRVGLVTGGASGIGRATVLAMAAAGAKVLVADVDEEGGAATVRQVCEAGGVAEFQRELVQAGVTSEYEAEIRHWIDEVEAEFELHDPSDEATGDFLPPTRVFNPEAELDD